MVAKNGGYKRFAIGMEPFPQAIIVPHRIDPILCCCDDVAGVRQDFAMPYWFNYN